MSPEKILICRPSPDLSARLPTPASVMKKCCSPWWILLCKEAAKTLVPWRKEKGSLKAICWKSKPESGFKVYPQVYPALAVHELRGPR
ncbi:MAG: hypothetical protein ABII93_08020 [Chrysiogenia bacterium]